MRILQCKLFFDVVLYASPLLSQPAHFYPYVIVFSSLSYITKHIATVLLLLWYECVLNIGI